MGIVRKFAAALGSMLALILFVATIGFAALHVLEGKAAEIVAESMRMQRLALEVDSRLQLARQAERDFMLRLHDLGVEGSRAVYANEFIQRLGEAGRNVVWLQEMEQFDAGKSGVVKSADRLEELRKGLERYSDLFRQLVQLAAQRGADSREFERKTGELDGEFLRLTSMVRQLAISASDGARSAHDGIAQSSEFVKYLLVFSCFLALMLAVSIIWVLNRTVAKSVVRLSDAATELSLGNLDARAIVRGDDEFGQLAESLNSMAGRITTLVDDLESQAAAASDRLFEAIDSISEGFLLYDHRERLILANRRVVEMAGRDASFLRPGTSVEEVFRFNAESGMFVNAIGREKQWVEDKLVQHRTAGHPVEEPLSDGRWVLLKTYHTNRGEVVVIMSDITERKRTVLDLAEMNSDLEALVRERTQVVVAKAMELKRANKRLRELDELKSAFLSSVSHELRTPLTSLLGFSKIIKRDFRKAFVPLTKDEKTEQLANRIQGNLDIIGSEGERLTRLINDVLDLSRIESGQEDWRFTEVDMAGIINRAVGAASGMFSPKPQVKLDIRRFDAVPLVLGDPDRLHQVVINLLSNAAKFTEAGTVSVDLFLNKEGMVQICVEDTGRGIKGKDLEHIFDKFHQANKGNTLTQKPSGTGLGLAISRQIVERYGGRIWADSRLGKGTTMHVVLPPTETEDKPLVLVVDDDMASRDCYAMYLQKAGYGVRTASDGKEGLALAAHCKPALITMDLIMPGMDGVEVIRELKKDPELASIPILVVSAAKDSHTAGGDAALLKPVDGNAFVAAVSGFLGHRESSQPVIVLSKDALPESCQMPVLWGGAVTRCVEKDLWRMLDGGFEGTVVVPELLANEMDLVQLSSMPHVQVVLLPAPGAASESTLVS